MSFLKKTRNLPQKISELISFYLYKRKITPKNCGKVIYINLSKPNLYSRYLYLLIKFFYIEGYRIYLPNNIYSYRKILKSDIYLNLILKENIIEFKNSFETPIFLEINDNNLSSEYFSFLIENDHFKSFHIPMSMHPIFYHKELWDIYFNNNNRKRSIFMIGNFESKSYDSLEFSLFGVISRTQIFKSLKRNQVLFQINTENKLEEFLTSFSDEKCIIIDRNNFSIKPEKLRKTLSQFYFFLACPGIVIPHSHNLIEALSVGCIPIIQEEYAQLLHPPLKHMENAITFSNLEDLPRTIEFTNKLSLSSLQILQKNVYTYYNENLTPKMVIKKILEKDYSKLYLQAEFDSVRHLKLQIAYKKVGKPKPKYT